jgi:hypothetical protein
MPEPNEIQRSDAGSTVFTPRDRQGMLFVGEQKLVRYDALGQQFDSLYAPAINVMPLGLRRSKEQKEADEGNRQEEKMKRGGNRGILPWPADYRKRIHAVGSVVDRWEKKMGYAKTWRPALDQPKWVTLTEAGLRRVGLTYHEVEWPDEDTEYVLDHYHHVSMVRLQLARQRTEHIPKHIWICERELEQEDTPRKLAGEDVPTRPDGILVVTEDSTIELATGEIMSISAGERIAIEVELSRKNFTKYARVVFPDHINRFTAVWYFCAPDAYNAVITARRNWVDTDEQRAHISIRRLEYD